MVTAQDRSPIHVLVSSDALFRIRISTTSRCPAVSHPVKGVHSCVGSPIGIESLVKKILDHWDEPIETIHAAKFP